MRKTIIIFLFAAICLALIAPTIQSRAGIPAGDTSADDIAGIIHVDAMKQKEIALDQIKTIELYDLEGNLILAFKEEEVKDIVAAFNNSLIDDTSYIEMITGSRMVISFNDDTTISLTSYGSDTHVVAGGERFNAHLISPELAKLLLAER